MATALRTDSPQANRASRSIKRTIGTSTTAVATTDLFTLVGGTLDTLEDGALVQLSGVLTGGAGLVIGQDYYLTKYSSTTYRLATALRGPTVDVTTDLTSTTTQLTWGLRSQTADGILSGDIASTPA